MAYPIIDSHQHVFWQGRDDAGLVRDMDEHGVDSAWLLTWETPSFENPASCHHLLNPFNIRADGTHEGIPLRDLVKARDRYPERFKLGYCPHPAIGKPGDALRSAVKIYGVQICGEWKFRIPFDDPRSLELFHVAGELGLPVVLHLDVPYLYDEGRRIYQPEWYGGTIDNLERALIACPETNFIGHAPGFWREIGGNADLDAGAYPSGPILSGGRLAPLFERFPNLYADLSAGSALNALRRDTDFAREFLIRFQYRMLFGRDYYGGDLQALLAELKLPEEATRRIMSENAQGLLKQRG